MSENGSEQPSKPLTDIVGRMVEFGKPGEGEGLSWGIEVDLDITDPRVKRAFGDRNITIPNNIKKIKYLDLAPQEALPADLRTIRSELGPKNSFLNTIATPT